MDLGVIKHLAQSDIPIAAEVIRASFATVAKDLCFTEQTFPTFTGFVTTAERLQTHYNWGWLMYGLYEKALLVGYASVSQEIGDIYEIHNLAVLQEYRHRGYGGQLLDFCKATIKERGGTKINIGIIEENTVLKNWYAANGFIHTGTKKFEHMPITVGYMELEVF